MTDFRDPARASLRLSDIERTEAVELLARALADGRITADEFTERSTSARSAVTRGDLAPLFADLPGAHDESVSASATGPAPDPDFGSPAAASGYRSGRGVRGPDGRIQAFGGTGGRIAVALTPFVAVALLLICGFFIPDGFRWSWIFLGLIPLSGIVVYGGGARRGER